MKAIYLITSFTVLLWFYYICICINASYQYTQTFKLNGLTEGWIFGLKYDNSDYQWRMFRNNFLLIIIFNCIFLLFSKLIKNFKNFKFLRYYYFIFSFAFVLVLHGQRLIYLLLILILYLLVIKKFSNKSFFCKIFIWIYPCIFKVLSEIYSGFDFLFQNTTKFELFSWYFCFNLVLLRMISFGLEYMIYIENKTEILKNGINESISNKYLTNCIKNDIIDRNVHCYECKENIYCQSYLVNIIIDSTMSKSEDQDFTFINFFIYVCYPCLYFSGPIITYNSFLYQIKSSIINRNHSLKYLIIKYKFYILRIVVLILAFELFNHLLYVNALLNNSKNSNNTDLKQVLLKNTFLLFWLGFFLLCFIWFKFSIIWKSARLFALLDDIITEENMNRCIFNNYCFEDFWRAWHKSFNQWLIKYIYIPVGGKKYKLLSIWLVFTFVALWHDLRLELLIWAWFICIALIPEIMIKRYQKHLIFKFDIINSILKYTISAIGIYLLILSNLIGFGMGELGFKSILITLYDKIEIKYILLGILTFVPHAYIIHSYIEYENKIKNEKMQIFYNQINN